MVWDVSKDRNEGVGYFYRKSMGDGGKSMGDGRKIS